MSSFLPDEMDDFSTGTGTGTGTGTANQSIEESSTGGHGYMIATMAIGIGVVLCLVVVIIMRLQHRRMVQKQAESGRWAIFSFLQEYDVEDVDLRKSPPGGWHCTYMNKLAYGIVDTRRSSSRTTTAAADSEEEEEEQVDLEYDPAGHYRGSHSSVARDALFMNDTENPPLLGGNRGSCHTTSLFEDIPFQSRRGLD